jgi:LAGLIDADG endonuclease
VSDNPSSAGNQQERLITIGWVLGFVDGEACFSIGLVRQAGGGTRKGYRLGWQVVHRFAVVQGARSVGALEQLRDFFGVGRLYQNRRHDNHREHLYKYLVERRDDLIEVVIPFFERFPLRTDKRHDFERFAECVRMVELGHHLRSDGLIEILTVMERMNHRKSRADLIRILRDQTPNIPIPG